MRSESEKSIAIPFIPVYPVQAYPEKVVGAADRGAGTGMGGASARAGQSVSIQESGAGCDTVCHTDHPGAVEEQGKLLHGDRRIDLLCPSADILCENVVIRAYRYSADHPFLLYDSSLPEDISGRTDDTVYLSNDSYRLYLFWGFWQQESG